MEKEIKIDEAFKEFCKFLFEKCFESGVESMKRKMLSVCDTDKPIEINGRAYFVQSDIAHLHKLFNAQ